MRVCSRGTGHVIAGLTQRTGSWVATRTADTACRSKGLLHRAGIRLPGNLGHATGQFAAARLSILLCGPGRRTCQGHSGNTHILHIACRWHGQWQQDWRVRQAVVSDMREGKRAPRGRRPAIVHETQGVGSSGQSRTSPAGSDDNADILYQPAGVFAPLHHDALGARHPRVQTRERHAMPLTTTPLMAPAPCRLVECPTTDAVARVPRPCRATQGWRLPTPNRKARR